MVVYDFIFTLMGVTPVSILELNHVFHGNEMMGLIKIQELKPEAGNRARKTVNSKE